MLQTWATDPSPIHNGTIADSWKLANKALIQALEFVYGKMGWCRRAFLPSANALIPLAVAMHRADGKLSEQDGLNYRRWLCLSALRQKLKNVETAVNSCLRELRNEQAHNASKALLRSLGKSDGRKLKADELDETAPMWGAATQVIYAWLVSIGAKDWGSGKTLEELAREGDSTSRASFNWRKL